ncbi:MAG: endopeptidase La [Candidatus Sumerlaeia bacterium]|nr:endopeptidase La [Candidatus Sumerlaeia bacterium]
MVPSEEKPSTHLLPIVALKDLVVFPHNLTPISVGRPRSVEAMEQAAVNKNLVVMVAQKNLSVEDPKPRDLYVVGTVAEVLQSLRMPDNTMRALVEGKYVARVEQCYERGQYLQGQTSPLNIRVETGKEIEAMARAVIKQFEEYVRLSDRVPEEATVRLQVLEDPLQIAYAIANYLQIKISEKQTVLSATSLRRKLMFLSKILTRENELLEIEQKILTQVRTKIDKSQKEYFLSEQLRAIEKELGMSDDEESDLAELRARMLKTPLSKEAREKVEREIARLSKMTALSPEDSVSRTYIEWILDMPWGKLTKDRLDLKRAQKILDADHYGLVKVKERIIEFLAVRRLVDEIKGPILCFVGPPGVGKTSLARSIARTLGRRFVRVSLGGVRDEAEIRGHRRTYVGALPGKIVQSLKKAGSMNPVFLLDEVDKMSADFQGDPSAALLEVLDPEQNRAFNDHYLEIDLDLSRVLFITTANTTEGIPPALVDRMEIIPLSGYTEDEKVCIAEQFLIPKQIKANGLSRRSIQFTSEAITTIIRGYTREAGVRNLEREIATICRKTAKEIVGGEDGSKAKASSTGKPARRYLITAARVRQLLGPKRFDDLEPQKHPEVGLATALAWTEVGGEILPTEVTVMRGKGNLFLTGNLGEVMQESAKAALSYIRSRADRLNVSPDFYRCTDIHVHVPEGAIPKDGPSAGVALATSMVSALSNTPVRQDLAMTGEITLRGKVLKIGGLKEKILAAHRARINTVIIPKKNRDDLEELSKKIRRQMKFVLAESIDDVLRAALASKTRKSKGGEGRRTRCAKPKS